MTKAEKLGAAMEFAQRVIEEAWSDTVTEVDARAMLGWAQELGLVRVKKADRRDADELGVEFGSQIFVYETWMDPTNAANA